MDFIAMAETLEAQAASLRRHAAELATEGQGALELDTPPHAFQSWTGGEQPEETFHKYVDVLTRGGRVMNGYAADVLVWRHHTRAADSGEDIVQWRLSADQSDT